MEKHLQDAVNFRKTTFRLISQSSRFYVQHKSVESLNNDLQFLGCMLRISESIVTELKNKLQFFSCNLFE